MDEAEETGETAETFDRLTAVFTPNSVVFSTTRSMFVPMTWICFIGSWLVYRTCLSNRGQVLQATIQGRLCMIQRTKVMIHSP